MFVGILIFECILMFVGILLLEGGFGVVFGEGNFDGNKCFPNTKTFALKYFRYSLNGNIICVILQTLFILVITTEIVNFFAIL